MLEALKDSLIGPLNSLSGTGGSLKCAKSGATQEATSVPHAFARRRSDASVSGLMFTWIVILGRRDWLMVEDNQVRLRKGHFSIAAALVVAEFDLEHRGGQDFHDSSDLASYQSAIGTI